MALATGRATLRELQDFYSVEDCYDIAEAAAVESYNTYLVNEAQGRRHGH